MKFVPRAIRARVLEAVQNFPALVLTGPRRSGKTTLLRRLFPRAGYVLLEDPDVQARARADPRGLLEELRPPVIFDEIQNVPELFAYVRTRIDESPAVLGNWIFTGSQEAPLMQRVSESLAGRAAILQLLPLSVAETPRVGILTGGYPEALARPAVRDLWFSSYLQTYLERDVRAIVNVHDLATFRRFLALLASKHGQILNRSDLAAPLGVSVPTINQWLRVLEITGQVILAQPYFENFGKRLIKSPKIYILDSGLTRHLLGIRTQAELNRSPFLGPLFEGFVASEILKHQVNSGGRKELYYFRDQQGLEVDFLFPSGSGGLWMIECKASKTIQPSMAGPLQALRRAMGNRTSVRAAIVHPKTATPPAIRSVAPGVQALDVNALLSALSHRK
ncbi:MAG: ATP-binding protein [Bryobacteraceae bacterium]|nr:ATP-binding protein [Bryobacteraceae bacterium]